MRNKGISNLALGEKIVKGIEVKLPKKHAPMRVWDQIVDTVPNINEQFSISCVEDIKSFTLWLLPSVTTKKQAHYFIKEE